MKVLMSSCSCAPGRGSEPGVGWNWAVQAAVNHEVWVLTSAHFRDSIEAELLRNPQPNLHFVFHDLPKWTRWWERGGLPIRLYLYLWELSAIFPALRFHRRIGFEVVHHVTLNSIETPGLLWLLKPPFIWGPVGGAQVPPPSFRRFFADSWKHERLRVLRKRLLKVNPIVRFAVRRSHRILAANHDTDIALRSLGALETQLELETAINPVASKPATYDRESDQRLRVLWSGVLIPRKAPILALEAIEAALERGVDCHLTIVGDGELREEVTRRASSIALKDHVSILGQVTFHEMQELYDEADVFLFTSLNDTSGNVILEAMSRELPVIVLDHQGAASIVTEESGYKVPTHDPTTAVNEMARAMQRLHNNPELRARMGRAARERVESEFTWDRKGEFIKRLYGQVLGSSMICVDSVEPAVSVTDHTRGENPTSDPEQVVSCMAEPIQVLSQHSDMRTKMGKTERSSTEAFFNWSNKGEGYSPRCHSLKRDEDRRRALSRRSEQ